MRQRLDALAAKLFDESARCLDALERGAQRQRTAQLTHGPLAIAGLQQRQAQVMVDKAVQIESSLAARQ